MQLRDQTITAQGVLSLVAIAVMLGYAAHALQLVPGQGEPAYAQEQIQTEAASTPQEQVKPDLATAKPAIYAGFVLKDGSTFLLRSSWGATYHLDDASKVEAFAGKSVKVTGKLDPTAELIYVEKIEETRA